MTKSKHLTLSDRTDIQTGIDKGQTFKEIAGQIEKDPSTISKEIRRNVVLNETTVIENQCATCPLLTKPPYVCNRCPHKRRQCGYNKHFYYAKQAQKQYEALLSEDREGIALNRQAFYDMEIVISAGLKKGQHLNHILATHDFGISRTSVYRYIDKGYMEAKNSDLPRKVKFKKRKQAALPPIPREDKIGRTYKDFQIYLIENDLRDWLEMNTVIGRIGGKVLLTFTATYSNFIFAVLLKNKTAFEVAKAIQCLKQDCHNTNQDFYKAFPVILTDNGGEFAYVDDIEIDSEGESKLFFCDPSNPAQKGKIEKNHTLVRDILPKGSSFDNLTQEDINLVMSHVNSVKRHSLHNKSAYEVFTFTFGEELAHALGIQKIAPEDVCQSPQLLKRNI